MTDHPEGHRGDRPEEGPEPIHGQVRFSNVSARLIEEVGAGVLSNNVLILSGPHEVVLDFVLRFGEPHRIVSRVVLPPLVARQFVVALQENIRNYETRFGALPRLPRLRAEAPPSPEAGSTAGDAGMSVMVAGSGSPAVESGPPVEAGRAVSEPSIQDIYDELRLPDSLLAGRYANAVLIRHSPTEFCFDFIANIFPKSAVSSRVYMAAPHIRILLESLTRSLNPPTAPPEGAAS